MNNFKQEYKNVFNNIKPNEELKNKILNKTIYKKKYNLKFAYTSVFIFIFLILTTSIIYANDIYYHIFEHHKEENYIEIKAPINRKANAKATLLNCYTVNDFENDLEIDLLESTMLDSTLNLSYKLHTPDNLLQRIVLYKKIKTKDYFDNLDYLQQYHSDIEIKYIILTKYVTKEKMNNYNKTYDYEENNLDIIYNENLKINMYYYSALSNELANTSRYSIRSIVTFTYDNVLYQIEGHNITKKDLLTIANSFE